MSTHMHGFQSFSACLRHFVLAKLAMSSIRVKTGGLVFLCRVRFSESLPQAVARVQGNAQ